MRPRQPNLPLDPYRIVCAHCHQVVDGSARANHIQTCPALRAKIDAKLPSRTIVPPRGQGHG